MDTKRKDTIDKEDIQRWIETYKEFVRNNKTHFIIIGAIPGAALFPIFPFSYILLTIQLTAFFSLISIGWFKS